MNRTLRQLLLLSAVGSLAFPAKIIGQTSRRFLPGGDLIPRILADPREPIVGGKLVLAAQGPTLFRDGLEAEANLGHTLPVLILAGDSPKRMTVIGAQGGVFARFNFETAQKDLISTDWVFMVPLVIRRGQNWYRFRYRHMSSHLGDEYIRRFEVLNTGYSRDALEATVYRQIGTVGLYGGGSFAVNAQPAGSERVALNAGLTIDGKVVSAGYRPLGGVDVYWDQDSDWRPRINAHVSLDVFPESPPTMRFVFEFLHGPSPQGEFHAVDREATLINLGLYLDL